MRLVMYNDWRVGVVEGETIYDITTLVPGWSPEWPQNFMVRFIAAFDELRPRIAEALATAPSLALAKARLLAPLLYPTKILAAPVNYRAHQAEMGQVYQGQTLHTIAEYGVFLKPSSSLTGPGSTVRIPFPDRRTDHEGELGLIIGKTAKNVRREEALDYVFGYTCVMDMTVRGGEDRTWRKGFDTFTPIGPWIVTADEIPDPDHLDLKLWVNDELRQNSNTSYLIYDVARIIELASTHQTLYPGDLISTGTPEGVGPIRPGDRVRLVVERVGELVVDVAEA
ncbi:MAG: fumarylacetoacetate hydrolase family protein [Firmicutes bacterium]|nr:fumarylacetoacetate hydrolase family protein [Alicyclobacillaceae bacterium]MCL6497073.1 fumarylacetoacetate hydrolase family protein [Bacillota bacterium]